MHVKGLKPLQLSGHPAHPTRNSLGYRTLEENARQSFTSEVMCLALSPERVPVPCSNRVPRFVYPTITGKNPWSTPFESWQTFPLLSVGISADRPSTGYRETR